ncbi:MAG: DUF4838 domain-containing protein, partial [Thermoanaerobaculia bacterium]|nr:DUF4838 domain-containing protein [Thermoanaerobaculia bacterium]
MLLPAAAARGDFVAVDRGAPVASIVVTAEETERGRGERRRAASDRMAAELLQDWIGRITGVELPILVAPAQPREAAIVVGSAAVEQGLDPQARVTAGGRPATGQGLAVRVSPHRILVAGETPGSTVRAVAVLLESVGCRWFMEGDLGRVHPTTRTLVFPALAVESEPAFRQRRIWGGDGWAGDTPWKLWHGLGGESFQTGHDWELFEAADFEAHPEWFRMDERGERVFGPWLNTGHPGLRAEFTRRFLARMRPGTHPSLSPPDAYVFDHSPESRGYDDPAAIEPSSGRVSMSNRFMDFANHVARQVADAYPEARLGFYAYSDYSEPPTRIDRLEPNLCIWLAPIRYSRFHRIGSPLSPSRRRLERSIEGWAGVASCLGYREYNYNLAEAMTPFSKVSTWSHDIPYLARRGFVGLNLESFATWNLSLPTLYLSARLAWDPYADPLPILDDLYRRFYGPAAAPMGQYWRELDGAWQGLPTESGSIYSLHLVFTPDRMRRLTALLDAAEAAVAGDAEPALTRRVGMARDGLQNAADFLTLRTALHEGRIDDAVATFESWLERSEAAIENGTGYSYTRTYLRRFVGRTVRALAQVRDEYAGRGADRLEVLPDRMQMAYGRELLRLGVTRPFEEVVDPAPWRQVRTYGATLDQQGLADRLEVMWYRTAFELGDGDPAVAALVFATVDGLATVWVNGRMVARPPPEGSDIGPTATFPQLTTFHVDASAAVRAGTNTVTVRVDHSELRELA